MVNATVKLILWKHNPNEFGQHPIYLQITVNRKTVYLSTGKYILEKQWDNKNQIVKESHPDVKTINPEITSKRVLILQRITELQVKGKEFSAKTLKASFGAKDHNNLYNFIDAFCIEVKNKKSDATIGNYMKHKRKLLEFHPGALHFEDITPTFLAKYEKHLRDSGDGNNYVHAIWKTLKTFFNAAKRKKLIDFYPFDQYENPIYVDPDKDYLSLDELKEMEKYADNATNRVLKETAIYFLFGCYSGLRISDWYKFDLKTHVIDNKVKLRATKNSEWVTIPLSGPLARNIERMRITPLTIEEPTLNEKIKLIAKAIKSSKQLSSHCARKTFAVTMCADRGVSLEVCATLMGITVEICFKNYYRITDYKINKEVLVAWDGL